MPKLLIFILALAFTGSASAITFNSSQVGPAKVFTAPSGVGTVYTSTPLVEYGMQALSAFRGNFNPINLAGTVGTVIAVQAISDGLNSLRAQVGVNNRSFPAPDGWTDSMTPPATAQPQSGVFWNNATCNGGNCPTPQAACTAMSSTSVATFVNADYYNCVIDGWFVASHTESRLNPASCPAGYSMVGGSCVINAPQDVKWPSDGQPSYYQKSDGTFAPHPNDPDTQGQPVFPNSRSGTDQHGNPVNEQIVPNSIGGVDIIRREESVHPTTGQPITHETKITTNDLGVITNTYQTDYNSTITNVSSSSVVTNNNGSSQNIDVSTLNKEATQLEIKQKLTVVDDNPAPSTMVQPVEQKYTDKIQEVTNASTDLSNNPAQTLTPVPYWTFASGTCYPAEFDAGRFGRVSFQPFCTIYDDHIRALIVFMFGVWGVLHVFGYWSEMVKEL